MSRKLAAAGGRQYVVKSQLSHAIPIEVFEGTSARPIPQAIRDFVALPGWETAFNFDEKVTHTSSTPPVCGDQTQRRTRLQ
jgi:hypothetical protein